MKFLRRLFIGAFACLVCAWIGLVVYAYWPTGVEERPARELAGPDDKFVSVDGLELRYREYGEAGPDRPTLVLIHGFGNSLQSFRLLAPLLALLRRSVVAQRPRRTCPFWGRADHLLDVRELR